MKLIKMIWGVYVLPIIYFSAFTTFFLFIFGVPIYCILKHHNDIYEKAIYKRGDLVERKFDGKQGQILDILLEDDTVAYSICYKNEVQKAETYEFELKLRAEK